MRPATKSYIYIYLRGVASCFCRFIVTHKYSSYFKLNKSQIIEGWFKNFKLLEIDNYFKSILHRNLITFYLKKKIRHHKTPNI